MTVKGLGKIVLIAAFAGVFSLSCFGAQAASAPADGGNKMTKGGFQAH